MQITFEGRPYNASIEAGYYPADNVASSDVKWLYSNGPQGLYQLGGISSYDSLYTRILYLKYPVASGDSWVVPHLVYDTYQNRFYIADSTQYDCVATDQPLDVPCGTFHCIVYHFRIKPESDVLEDWDYYLYYAPKVGQVGTIVKSSIDSTTKFEILLYQYSVK